MSERDVSPDQSAVPCRPTSEEVRELAYALLSQIEQRLNDLSGIDDSHVADTVVDCQRVILEVEAALTGASLNQP